MPEAQRKDGSFMAVINVYEQYFEAKGTFNGRKRHGALAALVSDSSAGQIRYYISVSFFPHDSADDFAVSYDACFEKTLFEGKGIYLLLSFPFH